ncbi:hypothetical protein QAD02_013706 [Eretmocerus hayati]|uniref:Uncharacterized protein n=1 Tax=Eretmocerus hayati TaxID=131215 RepID=A0ACC2P2W6_9HYME|nr:hypothetical protein QAD02_013706 [Eretmocerus hayati]
MGETVVDRTAFERKLNTLVESQKRPRVMWENSYVEKVKNILSGKAGKDHNSYYYSRMCELMQVGSQTRVVLKRTEKENISCTLFPVKNTTRNCGKLINRLVMVAVIECTTT